MTCKRKFTFFFLSSFFLSFLNIFRSVIMQDQQQQQNPSPKQHNPFNVNNINPCKILKFYSWESLYSF